MVKCGAHISSVLNRARTNDCPRRAHISKGAKASVSTCKDGFSYSNHVAIIIWFSTRLSFLLLIVRTEIMIYCRHELIPVYVERASTSFAGNDDY
jgi:hypothetical protein